MEIQNTEMNNCNVYVIHSAKPLTELKYLLHECGGFKYAGIIYKSVAPREGGRSHKEETKKTIVMCPENTILTLKGKHTEYQAASIVANYNWDSFPSPNPTIGESTELHISGVPNDYTVKEAEEMVIRSLAPILLENSFKVGFTPRLRETGEINGYGHITFDKSVPYEIIRLCKLILHNTPIPFKKNPSEKRMVTCVWHRQPGSGVERPKTGRVPRITKASEMVQRYQPAVRVDVSQIQPVPIALPTSSLGNL